jgi:hypothetical protein
MPSPSDSLWLVVDYEEKQVTGFDRYSDEYVDVEVAMPLIVGAFDYQPTSEQARGCLVYKVDKNKVNLNGLY